MALRRTRGVNWSRRQFQTGSRSLHPHGAAEQVRMVAIFSLVGGAR